MRFSDMMGSGDEKSSNDSMPVESDVVVADALAPYVETPEAFAVAPEPAVEAVPVDVSEPESPHEPAVVAVAPAPVGAVVPFEIAPLAPRDPIAATIADFAPISDDLLPRRR